MIAGRGSSVRLLDRSSVVLTGDVHEAFAIDEIESERVAAGERPLLHVWRHDKALVLGLRDRRLPQAKEAMNRYVEQGWSVMVRNSGGALVPLDAGVLNLTLIQPNPPGTVRIHDDFGQMAELIADAVQLVQERADVRTGEIAGAYCPGDYDLSISGVKFCGIAQRRRLGAYAIQAFIVVEGVGASRAAVASEFYRMAEGKDRIAVQSMGSLSQLLGIPVSAKQFADAIKQAVMLRFRFREWLAELDPSACGSRYDVSGKIAELKKRYDG